MQTDGSIASLRLLAPLVGLRRLLPLVVQHGQSLRRGDAARVLLKRPNGPGRDLDLALEAAERSEQVTHGKHSRTLKLLAEVLAARGEYPEAAEVQRRAVAVAYPEEKPDFEQQLAEYERRSER